MFNPDGRREKGLANLKKLGWGTNESVKNLDEDLWEFVTDINFGEVWSRPGLGLRDRELITIAALMAMRADGIASHIRNAHHVGITFEEIKELILQLTIYVGLPNGLFAMRKLKTIMAEAEAAQKAPSK